MVVTYFGQCLTPTSADSWHSPCMRKISVAEQRYKAVLAVIADGRTVTEVPRDLGVGRQTMHVWLARLSG